MRDRHLKLVLIEWVDALGCSPHWVELDSCKPELAVCQSVGWLLHDGEDCKVIVPHITGKIDNADRQGCGEMTIPASAIRRLVEIAFAVLEAPDA